MIVIRSRADIELNDVRAKVPYEICREIERLTDILDGLYGKDRDENSDGGIIVIAEKKADLKTIISDYASLEEFDCDGIDILTSRNENYLNLLYLSNNEYGVNVIIPERLLKEGLRS